MLGRIEDELIPLTYEAVVVAKSGDHRVFSIKKAPLVGADGRLVGFLAVSRDVTEDRLHVEELKALKEFNEAVLSCSNDMITVTDVDGMITYFNPAAEAITGYLKDEVLGRPITMFYRDADLALGKLEEIEGQGRPALYQAVIVDRSGAEHVFSVNKAPLHDEAGRLIGFTATSRDVTRRIEREEELRRLKEFNQAVLDSVHDLVVVTDLDGRVTYFNPMAEQVTGYSFEEVQGRDIGELYGDRGLSDQKLGYIRETGRANSYQAEVKAKDGSRVVLEVNKAPLHDADGRLVGFAAVSRDVTRRMAAEKRVCELEDLLTGSPVGMRGDLIQSRVRDLASTDFPECQADDPAGRAARLLIESDLPALPVVGTVRELVGMVTLKDLAARGLFSGDGLNAPVREVMRTGVPEVAPDTFYFDALFAMVRGRTQAAPVTEDGHLRALLTLTDLLRSKGAGLIDVLTRIENQPDVDGLAAFRSEVDRIMAGLVAEGALASQVTAIVTEFNDRITRRVIELTQAELGPPPVEYAWLGLGSEGRREQTLATDQDNALVFADAAENDPAALQYFQTLADRTVAGLERAGFPLCPGGVMANQRRWSGGMSTWCRRVGAWLAEPTPERTRNVMVFLDFRGVYGEPALADGLREEINRMVAENPRVLTPMAEDALSKGPPLGLFKRFLVERSGPNKGKINLKTQGTLILIDALRVLAVANRLFDTSTIERLKALAEAEVIDPGRAESIRQAWQTLMGLRLGNHAAAIHDQAEPSSWVDPDQLPGWDQKRLRDAFAVAEDLQKTVRQTFWWIK
jgi:CBS domain-containing protein